jgi:hypothetical protein
MARRKRALLRLGELQAHEEHAHVIHYACESFDDRPDGTSPRITSIAVRTLETEKTYSFSIHQVAELSDGTLAEVDDQYDKLERRMLDEFFEFLRMHASDRWLHWNMRDAKYGFPAIAHRYQVLGGIPIAIQDSRQCNLASTLIDLYSVHYSPNPRFRSLIKLNNISELDFMDGPEEATAFAAGDFVKLHHSTLRKVDNIATIYERIGNGTLRTHARRRDVYGGLLPWLLGQARNHWAFTILAILGSVASIVALR